jgi:hypothetical protein
LVAATYVKGAGLNWLRNGRDYPRTNGTAPTLIVIIGEIIMMRTKRTNSWALMSLIIALSVALVSCVNNGMSRSSAGQQQSQAKPRETPVAFQSTKENGGKRCEALWYTGAPGDEHDTADHHCFYLQEKLIKGALDGKLTEIRECRLSRCHNRENRFDLEGASSRIAVVVGDLKDLKEIKMPTTTS